MGAQSRVREQHKVDSAFDTGHPPDEHCLINDSTRFSHRQGEEEMLAGARLTSPDAMRSPLTTGISSPSILSSFPFNWTSASSSFAAVRV